MENLVGGFFANAENFAQIMDIQYIRIIIKHKITFLSYSGLEGLVRPSESPQRLGYGGQGVLCMVYSSSKGKSSPAKNFCRE